MLVIDPEGYVRSAYDGWGQETSTLLERDVLRWLRPENSTKTSQPVQPSGLIRRSSQDVQQPVGLRDRPIR
jgi:hypothetical protein